MPKKPDGIPPPYLPFNWAGDRAGTAAIKALDRGDATPEQQRLALTTIIEGICGYYDLSYRPNNEHDTSFAEGKRFVGGQLVKLTKLNINRIERAIRGEPSE
jgi:hypothetical protein